MFLVLATGLRMGFSNVAAPAPPADEAGGGYSIGIYLPESKKKKRKKKKKPNRDLEAIAMILSAMDD